jgi:hypothetical protein
VIEGQHRCKLLDWWRLAQFDCRSQYRKIRVTIAAQAACTTLLYERKNSTMKVK